MRRSLTILLILFAAAAYTPCARSRWMRSRSGWPLPWRPTPHSARQRSPLRSTATRRGPWTKLRGRAPPAFPRLPGLHLLRQRAGRRAGAIAAKQLFEENYPGIKVYMVYENPYFKVAVGDCLTTEEAIILKGRVSSAFPKAFVKNETLSIADLLNWKNFPFRKFFSFLFAFILLISNFAALQKN